MIKYTRRGWLATLAAPLAARPQGIASRGVRPQPRGKPSGLPFHARFTDVDLYNCHLEPTGGEIFRIVQFDHPAMVQEARGEHRLRIVVQDAKGRRVETLGVGTFERIR